MIARSDSAVVAQYQEIVDRYVDEVLDGTLVTGALEQAACQRYRDDLREGLFEFDPLRAARACDFFPRLKHTQGDYRGKPFILYPIQAFCVWNIFGWLRPGTRFRRFREAYLTFGRGNGKTPFGSALAIMCTAFDDPPCFRAETFLAATKRDQAKIAFKDIGAFIDISGLGSRMEVYQNEIRVPSTGATITAVPADSKTSDGFRVYFLLRDEVHAWGEIHREFYDKLETGLGKFDQDLAVTITTAGSDTSTLWIEQDQIAEQTVRRDRSFRHDELFVMICRLDEDDDVFDLALYPKANPLMRHGVVKPAKIAKLINEAKEVPSKKQSLVRFYANRRVESGSKSFTDDMWRKSTSWRQWPDLEGVTPHAAIDMGQTDDLAAIAYCYITGEKQVADGVKPTFCFEVEVFCARANYQLKKQPFRNWVDEGLIHVTDSEWTDPAALYESIGRKVQSNGIHTVALDPNNLREFALNVINEWGVEATMFIQRPAKYNEPLNGLKRAMQEGRITMPKNSLVEWCFANVIEVVNAQGHAMPDKRTSVGKIDPAVACIMAFSEATFAPVKPKSVYEKRGVISL